MVAEFIVKKDLKNWSCCSRRHYVKSVVALEEGKRRYFIKRFTVEAMKKAFKDFTEDGPSPDSRDCWQFGGAFWKVSRLLIACDDDRKIRCVKRLRFLFRPGVGESSDYSWGDRAVRFYIHNHRSAIKFADEKCKKELDDPEAARLAEPRYVGWWRTPSSRWPAWHRPWH